jgi:CBS domain-containing protein
MSLTSTRISDVMNKDVKVEEQNQPIFAISKIMSDNNIGSFVIIDIHKNKNPVGIVTERDIIRIIGSLQPMNFQLHIKDHMSRPVITISSNASISDTMQIMY